MITSTERRQRGFALASALILLIPITLIAVTIAYRATLDELMSANQRDAINAMAVSESGIEAGYGIVKNGYITNFQFDPDLFTLANNELTSGSVSGGNYLVTVYQVFDPNGNPVAVMHSHGSYRGATREIEVLMEMKPVSVGQFAILTETDINSISGNPIVIGPHADIHSNQDVIISGNPDVDGTISAVGEVVITGNPEIGGGEVSGAATVEIPHIYPPEFLPQATIIFTPNCLVKFPNGIVIANASSNPWHGWDCSVNDKWTMSGSNPSGGLYEAFYYVQGNVVVSGSPNGRWNATIVAEGYIEISGNAEFRPYGSAYPTGDARADVVLFLAGNDLKINGNPNQDFHGVLATHMEVMVSGNPSVTGAIIAENGRHAAGQEIRNGQEVKNIVDMNMFNGNMILNAIGTPFFGAGDKLTVTAWRELVD